MVDHIYITALVVIGLIITIVIVVHIDFTNSDSNTPSIVKSAGGYVYVPKHILKATITKYKKAIIHMAKSTIDDTLRKKFAVTESTLSSYIKMKYGRQINMDPVIIEQYITNEGIRYDECDLHEYESSEHGRACGRIIYLLDHILSLEYSHKQIELPLQLDALDSLLSHKLFDPQTFEKNKIVNELVVDGYYVESQDIPMTQVKPGITRYRPKPCTRERYNLHNYISDTTAQETHIDDNLKAKNLREAISSWQTNTTHSEPSDSSEINIHPESFNRISSEQLLCGRVPRIVQPIESRAIDRNGKQSLMDKWDYLEQQFLIN